MLGRGNLNTTRIYTEVSIEAFSSATHPAKLERPPKLPSGNSGVPAHESTLAFSF